MKLASELPPESQASDCVRVSVRFPSGERFERRFDVTNSLEVSFFAFFHNTPFGCFICALCKSGQFQCSRKI